MAIYTSQYGLPQQTISYLNQPLPNISGIFSLPQSQAVVPVEEITESLAPTGLTQEQLALLYPQYNLDRGGGDGRDEIDITNRIDNNAGIYSFKDLVNYTKSVPTAARIGSLFGPFGFAAGLIGTSIADKLGLTQKARDKKARETAAMRGEVKQLQARIDAGEFGGGDNAGGGGFQEHGGYGSSAERGGALHG